MNKMWSGAPQWASWALQPQHYQNMKPEEASAVDWAELAKQWIQMKETSTTTDPMEFSQLTSSMVSSPQVQPPGDESTTTGGEMDMEIEDDKGPPANGTEHQVNGETWAGWTGDGSWHPSQASTMGWGWGWPVDSYSGNEGGSQDTGAQQNYNIKDGEYSWPVVGTETYQGEYGRADRRERMGREFHHRSLDQERSSTSGAAGEADFQLDAAQRKKLPAWIREGLEKMEREKQRKMEKERQMSEKEELLKRKREEEARARRILQEDLTNDGKPCVPRKSKFDSDSDVSDRSRSPSPETTTPGLGSVARKRRSRFAPKNNLDGEEIEGIKEEDYDDKEEKKHLKRISSPQPPKSEEEKLQEMMLKLRRWMTEILLDVTTDMMLEVSTEVLQRARMKAPAVQVKKNSALASLSGGIGLGIYSDSESEGEGSGAERPSDRGDTDSDEELRETIKRKRRDFQATEREILLRLQVEEKAERDKQQNVSAESDTEDEKSYVNEGDILRKSYKSGSDTANLEEKRAPKDDSKDESPTSTGNVKPMRFVPPQDPEVDSTQPDDVSPDGSTKDNDSDNSEQSLDSEEDSKSSLSENSQSSVENKRKRKSHKQRQRRDSGRKRGRSNSMSRDRYERQEHKKRKKRKNTRSVSRSSGESSRYKSRSRSRDSYRKRKGGSHSPSESRSSGKKYSRERSRSKGRNRSRERRKRDRSRGRRRSRSRGRKSSKARDRKRYRDRSDNSRDYSHKSRGKDRRRSYRDGSEESRSGRSSRRHSPSYSRSRSRSRGYSRKKSRYHSRSRSRSRTPKKMKRRHRSRSRSSSVSPPKKSRRRSRSSS